MGSQTALKLPVIDFTKPDLKPGTVVWNLVKSQVEQALQEYGCFEALFHKIPLEIREAILGAVEELFDLPLQIKTRNVSKLPYNGYIGQYPHLSLYESIGIDDPNNMEKVEAQTSTFWPEGNTRFSKTVQSFSKQLSELDEMIRRMILEIFHLEKYIDEHMNSTNYLLRVMKYKEPKTSETQLGLSAHTDKNLLTILYQNEVHGLGVQSNKEEWIDVKPSKDSFIVFVGECLHAWLNGRLKATYHRVMMSGDKPRYSLGLFSFPKGGCIMKAPEELVDEAHPSLYKPFDYAEFLKFCYSEEGRIPKSAIKAYCGV
ncbi:probable 2-oxoglutarate-dependent dioxygenase AOP1 [Durio zibethinus]|uniref:Probable 2-oxoglutarate-dependent dioxygenase AOP1 n=1 Tax=Durio zibethinus TaxID=66656 RepID=A0A6P6BJ60_DURZI|nr:probable 2-oxoglutarate-dependent dioxygenase AOP1 [Durio zibethinus]